MEEPVTVNHLKLAMMILTVLIGLLMVCMTWGFGRYMKLVKRFEKLRKALDNLVKAPNIYHRAEALGLLRTEYQDPENVPHLKEES